MEKIAFLALKGSKKAYWHTIPWDILVRILPTFYGTLLYARTRAYVKKPEDRRSFLRLLLNLRVILPHAHSM